MVRERVTERDGGQTAKITWWVYSVLAAIVIIATVVGLLATIANPLPK